MAQSSSACRIDETAAPSSEPRVVLEEASKPQQFGRLRLISELGRGGMGVVYLAYDPALARRVALKVLLERSSARSASSRTNSARARLLQEARALAKLADPNVVTIFDVGEHEDSVYLTMEFIEGQPLAAWRDCVAPDPDELIDAMLQAGRGLAAAHASGIVHRDFKPENVMIDGEGRVVVLDFGLVQVSHELAEADSGAEHSGSLVASVGVGQGLTQAGTVMGTPAYMAPEQTLGVVCDAKADQFAFCFTFYELLSGRRPCSSSDRDERLEELRRAEIERSPGMPPWLHELLVRGLQYEPADRHESLTILLDAIQARLTIQRKRRGRILPLATVGIAALAASIAVAMATQDELTQCRGGHAAMAVLWSGDARSKVHAAFEATGLSYASDTAARVAAHLDGYAEDWVSTHVAACKATYVHGTQADADLDLRMACLKQGSKNLSALVVVFQGADADTVNNAVQATEGLFDLAACNDLEELRTAIPPPVDAETRQKVEAMRDRMTQARVWVDTGKFPQALEVSKSLLPTVEGLEYKPVQAELHALVGTIQRLVPAPHEAAWHLETALNHALAVGMHELAARMAIELVFVQDYLLNDREQSVERGARAQALLRAAGTPSALQRRLLAETGTSMANRGMIIEARQKYESALEIIPKTRGPNLEAAKLLSNIGLAQILLGNVHDGLRFHQRSYAMYASILGESHPQSLFSQLNLADALNNSGRTPEAERHAKFALQTCRNTLGEGNLSCSQYAFMLVGLQRNLGEHQRANHWSEMLVDLEKLHGRRQQKYLWPAPSLHASGLRIVGDLDGALLHARQGLEIVLKEENAYPVVMAVARSTLANVLVAMERYDEGLRLLQLAARDLDEPGMFSVSTKPQIGLDRGRALIAAGRAAEALPVLESALLASEQQSGVHHPRTSHYRLALATALRQTGHLDAALDQLHTAQSIVAPTVHHEQALLPYVIEHAHILLAKGQPKAALRKFEEAEGHFDPREIHPNRLADIHFGQARAYAAAHPSDAEISDHARALAHTALDEYESWDHGGQQMQAEIRRWLARRDPSQTRNR